MGLGSELHQSHHLLIGVEVGSAEGGLRRNGIVVSSFSSCLQLDVDSLLLRLSPDTGMLPPKFTLLKKTNFEVRDSARAPESLTEERRLS